MPPSISLRHHPIVQRGSTNTKMRIGRGKSRIGVPATIIMYIETSQTDHQEREKEKTKENRKF